MTSIYKTHHLYLFLRGQSAPHSYVINITLHSYIILVYLCRYHCKQVQQPGADPLPFPLEVGPLLNQLEGMRNR